MSPSALRSAVTRAAVALLVVAHGAGSSTAGTRPYLIHGSVISADGPVPGAEVRLLIRTSGAPAWPDQEPDPAWTELSVTADPMGRFELTLDQETFEHSRTQSWFVGVSAASFAPRYILDEASFNSERAAGGQNLGALWLTPGATLTGRLAGPGPDDRRIENAQVFLLVGEPWPPEPLVARSDVDGRFIFQHVGSGVATLIAYHRDYSTLVHREFTVPRPDDLKGEVRATTGRRTEVGLLRMAPPVRATGRVLDAEGRPIANAGIAYREVWRTPGEARSWPAAWKPLEVTESDDAGHFSVKAPPPDAELALRVWKKGYCSRSVTLESVQENGLPVLAEQVFLLHGELRPPADLQQAAESGEPIGLAEPVMLERAFSLSGRLVDEGGFPVPEARAHIQPEYRSAKTGDQGGFEFQQVPAGSYRVELSAPGFFERRIETEVGADGRPEQLLEIQMRRFEHVEVEVRVVSNTGVAVQNAELSVRLDRDGEPISRGREGSLVTDLHGRVSIPLVPTDARLDLSIEHPDYLFYERESVLLDPASPLVVAELQTDPALRVDVDGQVLDVQGRPLAGALVALDPVMFDRPWRRGSEGYEVYTDEEGRFRLPRVSEGVYRVTADYPALQTNSVRARIDEGLEPLRLVLGTGVAVEGTLTGLAADELSGVGVAASLTHGGARVEGEVLGDRFRIEGLGPGSWEIQANASGRHAKATVEIGGEQKEVWVPLSFASLVGLTGTILIDGDPPADGQVFLSRYVHGPLQFTGILKEDGEFRFDAVEISDFFLRFEGSQGEFARKVSTETDRRLEIALSTRSLDGMVVDTLESRPVAGARVAVSKDSSSRPWGSRVPFETVTDDQGRFRIDGLLPGTWKVEAKAPGYRATEVEFRHPPEKPGFFVAIGRQGELEVEVTTASGRLPGVVRLALRDAARKKAAEAVIQLDASGRGVWADVPSGEWSLHGATRYSRRAVRVKVPGPPARLDFRAAGALRVRVPALELEKRRTNPFAFPARIEATLEAPDHPGYAGLTIRSPNVEIDSLPSGLWRVRVTAEDGRVWEATARVEDEQETLVVLDGQHLVWAAEVPDRNRRTKLP